MTETETPIPTINSFYDNETNTDYAIEDTVARERAEAAQETAEEAKTIAEDAKNGKPQTAGYIQKVVLLEEDLAEGAEWDAPNDLSEYDFFAITADNYIVVTAHALSADIIRGGSSYIHNNNSNGIIAVYIMKSSNGKYTVSCRAQSIGEAKSRTMSINKIVGYKVV